MDNKNSSSTIASERKRIESTGAATKSSTPLKKSKPSNEKSSDEINWDELSSSLKINNERDYLIKEESGFPFINKFLKHEEDSVSLSNSSVFRKKSKRKEVRELLRKGSRDRKDLHGMGPKNYIQKKYSVFLNFERIGLGNEKKNDFA